MPVTRKVISDGRNGQPWDRHTEARLSGVSHPAWLRPCVGKEGKSGRNRTRADTHVTPQHTRCHPKGAPQGGHGRCPGLHLPRGSGAGGRIPHQRRTA